MRVVVDGSGLSWNTFKSGVPQRSVLGSLLYHLYVNDIPQLITGKVNLFADDMNLWHVIRSKNDEKFISQSLETLKNYSERWLLKFNAVKRLQMSIGHDFGTKYRMTNGKELREIKRVNHC